MVREGDSYRLARSVECDGELLLPLPRHHETLRNVLLPTGVKKCPTDELVWGLMEFMGEHANLPCSYLTIVVLFVLSSWFVDRLRVAPCLLVVGPSASGKSTLLNLLALLCRRPYLVGDVSSAGLYHAFGKTCPTVLLDESSTQVGQSPSALRHFLRIGTTRLGVARHDGMYDVYGVKVIAAVEPPNDPQLLSRSIIAPMLPGTPLKRDLRDPSVQEQVRLMQQSLLQYRLENWCSVRPATLPGSEKLLPRTQDLLSDLAAVIPHAKGFREYPLVDWFRAYGPVAQEDSRSVLLRLLNSMLFRLIHTQTQVPFENEFVVWHAMVSGITLDMNEELRLRGEKIHLTPEAVGHALTALGFMRRDRTSRGMRLWLDSGARKRIHQNARVYGQELLRVPSGEELKDCPLCKEGVSVDLTPEDKTSSPRSGSES